LKINASRNLTGFTLIELMIVIFIIGIASAAVIFHGGHRNNAREAQAFAEQLKSQIQIIREQSVSQLSTMGLMLNAENYEFYQYIEKPEKKWIPLREQDNFWKSYTIPSSIKLNLALELKKTSTVTTTDEHQPQIIFLPNGEITPFTLTINSEGATLAFQIIVHSDGSTSVQEIK